MANKKKHPGQSGIDGNDEVRTKIVKVRYSPSEFQELSKLFDKVSHATLSPFIREKSLSQNSIVEDKKGITINHVAEIYQLSKIGTNVNQVATAFNRIRKYLSSGGQVQQPFGRLDERIAEFEQELEEIRKYKRSIYRSKIKGGQQ